MSWAVPELGAVEFGDKRLTRRSQVVLAQLGDKPTYRTPTACGGWPETVAAYRLFDNDKVTPAKILAAHRQRTLERMAALPLVLCVADTTEFDHTDHREIIEGLGPLNYDNRRGQVGHFLLAVSPERVPLGVLGSDLWVRDEERFGSSRERKHRKLEDKESAHWVDMVRNCKQLAAQCPGTRLVYVADREAEMHELLMEVTTGEIDCVIRAQGDRAQPDPQPLVRTAVKASPALGRIEFDIPATDKRTARHVVATVRSAAVTLRGPWRSGQGHLPHVPITLVHVVEDHCPPEAEPIEWFLFTTLVAGTLEQAVRVIELYRCRWTIEVFFRVLKTGCRVEKIQLHHIDRLRTALAFYLIIAWRVLFLTMLGRTTPELPCDAVFDTEEWQAIYMVTQRRPPPAQPPPLDQVVRMMATFGGFLGRACDGFPGPQAIWVGLQRTRDFVLALQAHKEATRCV